MVASPAISCISSTTSPPAAPPCPQVGMLFALPTLRMLMDAPLGSYIDLVCFAWCMVLVAIAVVLFFSASYAEHSHKAGPFQRYDKPQAVMVVNEHETGGKMEKLLSRVFSRKASNLMVAVSQPLHQVPSSPAPAEAAAGESSRCASLVLVEADGGDDTGGVDDKV